MMDLDLAILEGDCRGRADGKSSGFPHMGKSGWLGRIAREGTVRVYAGGRAVVRSGSGSVPDTVYAAGSADHGSAEDPEFWGG